MWKLLRNKYFQFKKRTSFIWGGKKKFRVKKKKSKQFEFQCQPMRSAITSKCHKISNNNLAIRKEPLIHTTPMNLNGTELRESGRFQKAASAGFHL